MRPGRARLNHCGMIFNRKNKNTEDEVDSKSESSLEAPGQA